MTSGKPRGKPWESLLVGSRHADVHLCSAPAAGCALRPGPEWSGSLSAEAFQSQKGVFLSSGPLKLPPLYIIKVYLTL